MLKEIKEGIDWTASAPLPIRLSEVALGMYLANFQPTVVIGLIFFLHGLIGPAAKALTTPPSGK